MCLTTVDSKPKKGRRVGYKIVEKRGSKYLSWDYTPNAGTVEYPIGVWLEDPNDGENPCPKYRLGFHVTLALTNTVRRFHHRKGNRQEKLVVIKCKFKEVVATGGDFFGATSVARKIMNLGEIEEVHKEWDSKEAGQ